MRLFFAASVIISHGAEIVDGSNINEPVSKIFGTVTAGGLAVIGFFIISGYLILGSFLENKSKRRYIFKRILRIYPGFLLAFWICVLVVAPLGGARIPANTITLGKLLFDSLALQYPGVSGAFDGTHLTLLNGSMWTISYEFRCYLITVAIGLAGLASHRLTLAIVAVCGLILTGFFPIPPTGPIPNIWGSNLINYALGEPLRNLRLVTAFLTGSAFYLYRDRLAFPTVGVVAASVGLLGCMFSDRLVIAGTILLGGYLIFAFAFRATWAFGINSRNDISYGVYLYAWPATKLINWWYPKMGVFLVTILTLMVSIMLGWASWLIVEKPAMNWLKRRLRN